MVLSKDLETSVRGGKLEQERIRLREKAGVRGVPGHIIEGFVQYIVDHRPTFSRFLDAVLSNDLKGAFQEADDTNRYAMFEIVNFLYNDAPHDCWGSPEEVSAWVLEYNGK